LVIPVNGTTAQRVSPVVVVVVVVAVVAVVVDAAAVAAAAPARGVITHANGRLLSSNTLTEMGIR
jgi:hypothetical protein